MNRRINYTTKIIQFENMLNRRSKTITLIRLNNVQYIATRQVNSIYKFFTLAPHSPIIHFVIIKINFLSFLVYTLFKCVDERRR